MNNWFGMNRLTPVLVCQIGLLAYHQATTLIDLFPFNGVRKYTPKERFAEAGVNAVLMSLAPIGFAFKIGSLMTFGVVYYFVLFGFEIIIWWIPYFTVPSGKWRNIYNRLLSIATSNFKAGDTLNHWLEIHARLHANTVTVLPRIPQRVVPNLEHMILHLLTAITAAATAFYFFGQGAN